MSVIGIIFYEVSLYLFLFYSIKIVKQNLYKGNIIAIDLFGPLGTKHQFVRTCLIYINLSNGQRLKNLIQLINKVTEAELYQRSLHIYLNHFLITCCTYNKL